MTTATPSGLTASRMASAIWRVSRSCTCRRREYISAIRASLLKPMTCGGVEESGIKSRKSSRKSQHAALDSSRSRVGY